MYTFTFAILSKWFAYYLWKIYIDEQAHNF